MQVLGRADRRAWDSVCDRNADLQFDGRALHHTAVLAVQHSCSEQLAALRCLGFHFRRNHYGSRTYTRRNGIPSQNTLCPLLQFTGADGDVYDPERKGDWDVVRGRLSDEYRKTSDNLKTLAEGKQAEYEQLRNEYFDALEGADSPEKAARLAELTKRGGELSKEIDTANSRSRYADNFANELSRDLDPSKRTTYEGVGGKSFTDLHQSMIQKQGNAVKDFKGTCGDCSAANTMTALGDSKSEAEVVQRARDLNACVDKKIPSFLPESLKEKMRGSNGGTSVAGRSQILDSFGYDCDNRTNQSLAEISQQIENGKGAIINVDHRVLNKQRDVTAMNPVGTDHALTITGIEKDAAGNAIGLWIHDTGVCSNMGNAFYCNAQDYAVWKSTPNCTVQYVSKK